MSFIVPSCGINMKWEGEVMAISCAEYEQLELAAMRENSVGLIFKNVNSDNYLVKGVIETLYVKQGEEYLLFKDGQEYALNDFQSIDRMVESVRL